MASKKMKEEEAFHLVEMWPVGLPKEQLVFLSEPAQLRFDHPLLSTDRRQVEEVEPLSGVTCTGDARARETLHLSFGHELSQSLKQRAVHPRR